MNILHTLPTDSFITAAFAELLEDVTNLLTAARQQKPSDREEIAFWARQLTALNKAERNWRDGVRMLLSENSYLLPSSRDLSKPVYRLVRMGGVLICDCKAGVKGTLCWHHQLACIIERAAELENEARKAAELVSGGGSDTTPEPLIPHAAEASAWLGGQQLLQTRLAATAQYVATLRSAQQRETPATAEARRLGVRLMQARKRSAYFTSAFYLNAA